MDFRIIKFANIFRKYCSTNFTKKEVLDWINNNLPFIVQQYIILPKRLKDCSGVSSKIVAMARHDGLEAFTEDVSNHVVAILTCKEGYFTVDATYLQSNFVCGGSLTEVREDPEEFEKMKELFSKLENNPMEAVKITFSEDQYISGNDQHDFESIYSGIENRKKLLEKLKAKNMTIEDYENYLNKLR